MAKAALIRPNLESVRSPDESDVSVSKGRNSPGAVMPKKNRKGDPNITEADIDAKIREHNKIIGRRPVAWAEGLGRNDNGDFWVEAQAYFEQPELQKLASIANILRPEMVRFLIALADTLHTAEHNHDYRDWTAEDDELAVVAMLLLSPKAEAFRLGLERFAEWERAQAEEEAKDLRRTVVFWIQRERELELTGSSSGNS